MGVPVLCTRDDVKLSPDIKFTARMDPLVDRAIASATDTIQGDLHVDFFPRTATRSFDWPNYQYARPWRLWLDSNLLISVTTLVAGGVTIPATDYRLRRSDDLNEPPYTHIELLINRPSSFSAGDTHQQAVVVTGVWAGARIDETQVGQLTAQMELTGSSGLQISPTVGVGSILRLDSERMIVAAKTMIDSGQNLGAPGLTAGKENVTVPVSDGTAFEVDEILLVEAERMLVVDIAGNNLIVKRAWDGTVLAAHTAGVDIYALADFTVDRAQLGTTAAVHVNGTAIYRWDPPPAARSLCVAEAIVTLQQESAAYGRTVGSGESEREASGRGLAALRKEVQARYGRMARIGAI